MTTERRAVHGAWARADADPVAVLDAITAPLALLDLDHRYVAVNAAYEALTGRDVADLIGSTVFDVFPQPAGAESTATLQHSFDVVMETAQTHILPLLRYDIETDGVFEPRFWRIANSPIVTDGRVTTIVNHPEEVTSFIEERLRLAARAGDTRPIGPAQARAIDEVVAAEIHRLVGLNDLASSLVGAGTPEEVGRAVMRDGLGLVDAIAGAMSLLESDRLRTVATAGSAADAPAPADVGFDVFREPFRRAVESGEALLFPDRASLLAAHPSSLDDAEAHPAHRAWAILPLRAGREVSGALGLVFDRSEPFTEPRRLLLSTLANLTAQAAARARLLDEQRDAIASVEESTSPNLDPIDGASISHIYLPATVSTSAGGDWYDTVRVDDDTTLIAIGDVADHGTAAIGEMGRARSVVHTLALDGRCPSDIAREADRVLSRLASTFTTAFIGILEHRTRRLTWTTAGHPYPIVVDADGRARTLGGTHGAPLGTGFTGTYGQDRVRLDAGDRLVLYTDGLIESADVAITESIEALRRAVERVASGRPDDLARELFDDLHRDRRHRDDVAILALGF